MYSNRRLVDIGTHTLALIVKGNVSQDSQVNAMKQHKISRFYNTAFVGCPEVGLYIKGGRQGQSHEILCCFMAFTYKSGETTFVGAAHFGFHIKFGRLFHFIVLFYRTSGSLEIWRLTGEEAIHRMQRYEITPRRIAVAIAKVVSTM